MSRLSQVSAALHHSWSLVGESLLCHAFSRFKGSILVLCVCTSVWFLNDSQFFLLFRYRISLNTMTLNVKSDKVYTRHGVPISVTGIAQVFLYSYINTYHHSLEWDTNVVFSVLQMKIQGQNKQMLAAACQMFMGKSEGEIAHIALETLEGHQRAIIAHLTVEVNACMQFVLNACILFITSYIEHNL